MAKPLSSYISSVVSGLNEAQLASFTQLANWFINSVAETPDNGIQDMPPGLSTPLHRNFSEATIINWKK